jgi:hypothetical protein
MSNPDPSADPSDLTLWRAYCELMQNEELLERDPDECSGCCRMVQHCLCGTHCELCGFRFERCECPEETNDMLAREAFYDRR